MSADDVREIKLTSGYVAIVDAADFAEVSAHKWYAQESHGTVYGRSDMRTDNRKRIFLHRFLMKPDEGDFVDHIDGNGLNCRRANMRIVTRSQNCMNRKLNCNNRTGAKGVSKSSRGHTYVAKITYSGQKQIYLGTFKTIEEASAAYQAAAEKYHAEFRRNP